MCGFSSIPDLWVLVDVVQEVTTTFFLLFLFNNIFSPFHKSKSLRPKAYNDVKGVGDAWMFVQK
jgi:hypothetical protein